MNMLLREVSAPPPGAEPEEFILSDGSIDRMGDVIDPKGWQLDKIRTPPPVLYNHNKDEQIGSWADIREVGSQLVGRILWADFTHWPKGRYIRDLVRGGHLRTVSVGFRPLAREPLSKDASKEYGPFRFTKTELLECSLVTVPANPNAIALAKSLNITDQIVTEVFGESARSFVASTGKPAIVPPVRKSTPMSNATTIANKIQTAQQSLNALLSNYEELAGRSEMNEDDVRRYRDDLPRQIDDARAELASHQKAERTLFGNSEQEQPAPRTIDHEPIMAPGIVKGKDPASDLSRMPAVIQRKKLEPSDHQFRALAAWTKAQASHDPDLGRTLRDMYRGQGGEITDMVLRAAVNPANTTVATWAAELVQTDTMPFLDRLIAESIYGPLANMGARYTFGNAGVLKIPVRANTPTLAGAWTGRGKRQAGETGLVHHGYAVSDQIVGHLDFHRRDGELLAAVDRADHPPGHERRHFDGARCLPDRQRGGVCRGPPGRTAQRGDAHHGLGGNTACGGDGGGSQGAGGAIHTAGGGRSIVFIMNPAQALSLGVVQTTTGDFLFADASTAVSRFGGRLIVSASCPAGRVIAIDAADFATAQGDAPRFAVSTDATLHEEDTTPLALTTGAQGSGVVASPMRSLFQTDAVAVRMSLYVTWGMRRTGMVQTIAAVSW